VTTAGHVRAARVQTDGVDRRGHDRLHVVIVGGGVAALEALLALRALAGPQIQITMLAPERDFLYRPVTVAEAFGRGEARAYPLAEIVAREGGGELIGDALAGVEVDGHVAVTVTGARISYDVLVVAAGAIARDPLP
jgi:sulfide:quinone oxidoreductase